MRPDEDEDDVGSRRALEAANQAAWLENQKLANAMMEAHYRLLAEEEKARKKAQEDAEKKQ
jgi:hypothetical protein